jgi:hypothetical protein
MEKLKSGTKQKSHFRRARQRAVAYPGIFFGGGGVQQIQQRTEGREWGSGGSSPVFRGFTQFVNEQTPYSD